MTGIQNKEKVADPPISSRTHSPSFGAALVELRQSIKKLVKSESTLARAELKASVVHLGKDVFQIAIFSVLLVLSALAFLSFLIIGLGQLFDNNFWLSSLLLSLVLGVVGAWMVFRRIKDIQTTDLTLPRTRRLFQKRPLLRSILSPAKTPPQVSPEQAAPFIHSKDVSKVGRKVS